MGHGVTNGEMNMIYRKILLLYGIIPVSVRKSPIFLSLEEIFASLESVKRILAHPKCISGPPQENAYREKWA